VVSCLISCVAYRQKRMCFRPEKERDMYHTDSIPAQDFDQAAYTAPTVHPSALIDVASIRGSPEGVRPLGPLPIPRMISTNVQPRMISFSDYQQGMV